MVARVDLSHTRLGGGGVGDAWWRLRRVGRRVGESWLQWVRWGSGRDQCMQYGVHVAGPSCMARWKSLGKSINVLYIALNVQYGTSKCYLVQWIDLTVVFAILLEAPFALRFHYACNNKCLHLPYHCETILSLAPINYNSIRQSANGRIIYRTCK